MKKIFLPLVALCGLVAGLTLTSCGGGGGGKGAAGKTYHFKRSYAVMEVAFGNRTGEPEETPEKIKQYYDGFVSYKESAGSNGTSMTVPDEVTIDVTEQKDTGLIYINVNGQAPESLQENAVLAFLGLKIRDNAAGGGNQVDPQDTDYIFEIELPAWPDKTPVTGQLIVTKLMIDEEDVEDDPDPDAPPAQPLQSNAPIEAERVF